MRAEADPGSAGWKRDLALALESRPRLALLGLGSELSGDDAAGMLALGWLERLLPPREDVLLLAGSTAPENFTGQLRQWRPELLLLLDAARFRGRVGETRLLDWDQGAQSWCCTHSLPLEIMLDYLRLDLSCRVLLLGFQAGGTEFGSPPSPEIITATREMSQWLADFLSN